MSNYFYNNIPIGNIVSSSIYYGSGETNNTGNTNATSGFNTDDTQGYIGFPGTKITPSNRDIVNLNVYTYQGSSIFNNRVPMHYDYNNGGDFQMPFNGVNRLILLMIGAGGGGGGGGVANANNDKFGGGGGQGGLGLPRLYGLNYAGPNYVITIGGGGNLGFRGANATNAGGDGGLTQFQSPGYIISINGSRGGGRGNSATIGANGNVGTHGADGTSAVNATNVGQPAYTINGNYSGYIRTGGGALNLGGWTDTANAISDTTNTFGINTQNLDLSMLNFGSGQGNTARGSNLRNWNGTAGAKGFIRVYYLYD